jgi:Zn-dependent protease
LSVPDGKKSAAFCVYQQPDLLAIAIPLLIVLGSLTVHEAAHAWTADKLGDPTARMLGRVSFNPLVHIDPIGTILLPLISAFSGLPVIGWAKPVPVNMNQLRHPRRDFAIIAAAGPASNILIAVVAAIVFRVMTADSAVEIGHAVAGIGLGALIVRAVVQINVMLAVFNMIPVPPLDGGNVLAGLLPPRAAEIFVAMRSYGFIALYALMFTGVLSRLIYPPAFFLIGLLLP